jgi:hypothetical protein
MCKCEGDVPLAPPPHVFRNTPLNLSSWSASRLADDVLLARLAAIERERHLDSGCHATVPTGDPISDDEAAWWREAHRWGC